MALAGKTENVQPYVLAFADRVVARAGVKQPGKVLSGYRPGATILGSDSPSLHASGRAVDLGTYYGGTLTRLGQAALAEAGGDPSRRSFAGTVNGWEIIFNSFVGGNHFDHLHVGWEGAGVPRVEAPAGASGGAGALSTAQLQELWISAGGNRRQAAMAATVASLESRGRPNARNVSKVEDSRGLWQINVIAHPQWALRDLYNPKVNVQAAISISSNGRNWDPWTTADEAARMLGPTGLGGGERAAPAVVRPGGEGGGGPGGAAGWIWDRATGAWKQVTGWVEAVTSFVGFITDPLNWLRLVEVVIGSALVLSGLGMLVVEFAKRGPVGSAAGALAGIVPAGRVGALLRRGASGPMMRWPGATRNDPERPA